MTNETSLIFDQADDLIKYTQRDGKEWDRYQIYVRCGEQLGWHEIKTFDEWLES